MRIAAEGLDEIGVGGNFTCYAAVFIECRRPDDDAFLHCFGQIPLRFGAVWDGVDVGVGEKMFVQ